MALGPRRPKPQSHASLPGFIELSLATHSNVGAHWDRTWRAGLSLPQTMDRGPWDLGLSLCNINDVVLHAGPDMAGSSLFSTLYTRLIFARSA